MMIFKQIENIIRQNWEMRNHENTKTNRKIMKIKGKKIIRTNKNHLKQSGEWGNSKENKENHKKQ